MTMTVLPNDSKGRKIMDGKALTKEELRQIFLEPCYTIDKSGNGLKI